MGWFSKKGPTQDEVRAYQIGQDAGAEMATAFNVYQQQRFGPIYGRYLDVLRDALQSALKDDSKPPLLVCRAHLQIFEENVKTLHTQMLDETMSSMSDWFERARVFGVFEQTQAGVQQSIETFCGKLLNEGGALVEAYIPVIEDAESAWQRKFPERVAEFYGRK